jgi:murein DD-endopeptidase MepM/ murein hydrolase activator NlpD
MGRLLKRAALLPLLALLLAAPAAGEDIHAKKQSVDDRIAKLHDHIQTTRQREAGLRNQIADVTQRIRSLEHQVGDVSTRLHTLEADLALHQERLSKLTQLFELQTRKLRFLERQYHASVERLNNRLVDIYETDDVDTLAVVLSADSFQEMLDQVDYLKQIGTLDKRIAHAVGEAKLQMRQAQTRTRKVKASVESETRVISARADQQRSVRDELVSAQGRLSDVRSQQKVSLDELSAEEQAQAGEMDALQVQSASLAAQIRAAQQRSTPSTSPGDTTPSHAGFIWPVSGPVTSSFGWRWGRMHEGIDIGVSAGTPIHAAASGTVIYCGWMEGYGNLVVVDHANGLATAYAHQSAIAVTCGQGVIQGQVVGYVGSTGHSTGPHLHFEVRVNGSPVDPLGYL